jgi:hypothetical protein
MVRMDMEIEFVRLKFYAFFNLENRGRGTEIVCWRVPEIQFAAEKSSVDDLAYLLQA